MSDSKVFFGDKSPHSTTSDDKPSNSRRGWIHAPRHWLQEQGIYIVTAGTYEKKPFYRTPERLDLVQTRLFEVCQEYGWQLQAWAIMANHYHFVALSPENPATMTRMLAKLHMTTSKAVNLLDNTPGRKTWFQFWDTQITNEHSYLARLRYVHHNPVKHGLVKFAVDYPWCSAAWFNDNADSAFKAKLETIKIDTVNVIDDF